MKNTRWLCALLIAALLMAQAAWAEALRLPADTRTIEAGAFEGDAALTTAELPEPLETIGPRAFARSGLVDISIPGAETEIAGDAFEGCPETLVVHGVRDSMVQAFCAEHDITFQYDGDGEAGPEWSDYDALIAAIRQETNTTRREALMHQAEDMLMETGAVVPLYYYYDIYLQKKSVKGVEASVYGFKNFKHATVDGSDALRVNLASEPYTMDPALNSSIDGASLAIAAFRGLYTYGSDGKPAPDFATGCKVSNGGKTYTFTLRKGLKWSNGKALNASDFEKSWKRAAGSALEADYGYMFDIIRGYPDNLAVTASEDGGTLRVELTAPCAYMLDLMAFPAFFAVPPAAVDTTSDAWCRDAGFACSGPFVLTGWDHNHSMTFVKNPNYWDADSVRLAKLTYDLSGDEDDIYAAYRAGELDFSDSVPFTSEALGSSECHIIDNLGTYYCAFNVNSKLFKGMDAAQASLMRRAISMLIDRNAIVDEMGVGQEAAVTFVPEGMSDGHGGVFRKNDGAYTYPNKSAVGYCATKPDVKGAIHLLKQAGFVFKDGKLTKATPISMTYLTNDGSGHVGIANIIRKNLAVVGIDMKISTCDWDTYQRKTGKGDFVLARCGWVADFNDPINMLEMWCTESGNNICQLGR